MLPVTVVIEVVVTGVNGHASQPKHPNASLSRDHLPVTVVVEYVVPVVNGHASQRQSSH